MAKHRLQRLSFALVAASLASSGVAHAGDDHREHEGSRVKHVLFLSVDGFHAVDLENWVADHPGSTLAKLSRRGVTYDNARTTTPSDSFPGLLSFVTGGTSKSTGVYYDDSYDRTLYPPGSKCVSTTGYPGTEVVYDESIDFNQDYLFSGGINPLNLPMEKTAKGCKPVQPHEFLKVNTIFEVIKKSGGYTAWSDKHPAYDIVNGPSGEGVDDLYTPEINSLIVNGGTVNGVNLTASGALCNGKNSLPVSKVSVYTDCIPTQKAYDDVKVQAVINEIEGLRSDGTLPKDGQRHTPTILGMNFQAVSVGQKLPVGGYVDAVGTPSANLEDAISHTDASIGRIVAALAKNDLLDSTAIIISAKHGQSPINFQTLAMEGGGHAPVQTVTDPLGYINNADPNVDNSQFTNPNPDSNGHSYANAGHLQTDDVGIVWLQNQSASNIAAVVAQLTAPANRVSMYANVTPPETIFDTNINYGPELAELYGDPTGCDPVAQARAPNVFIQPNAGVIYSGSSKKIAEHGGGAVDDTNVALLVVLPGSRDDKCEDGKRNGKRVHKKVTTTQVAPTILELLGIDGDRLEAVRKEHTRLLPGIFED